MQKALKRGVVLLAKQEGEKKLKQQRKRFSGQSTPLPCPMLVYSMQNNYPGLPLKFIIDELIVAYFKKITAL